MTDILINMKTDGSFSFEGNVGRIEEYCAKRLKILLNSDFKSSSINYYTLSFEPFSLSRKIITENIYKDSNATTGIFYSDGYIFCPIYDYIAVSPNVMVQVDGYELDSNGNVKTIIKSGIFTLDFSPSLTGEGIMLETVRPDVKFAENVKKAVEETVKTMTLDGKNIVDGSVGASKIGEFSITHNKLAKNCIYEDSLSDGCVMSVALADTSVTTPKIANSAVTNDKIAEGSITTSKIAQKNITSVCLADNSISNLKLMNHSVGENNIRTLAVSNRCIARKSITPDKLDRKYLTEHQSLNGYATQSWVEGKNYVSDISMKADKTDLPNLLSNLKNDIAVSYVLQNLTEQQKEIARKNIGAVKNVDGKGLSANDFTDADKLKLNSALTEHQDLSNKADKSELSDVAFSGSFNSLSDVPELSDVAYSGSFNSLKDLPQLSDVALSGSYNDLKDLPEMFNEEMKAAYDEAYAHSKLPHAPHNAEENIIVGAIMNGEEIKIKDKKLSFGVISFAANELRFMEV